MPDEAAAYYLDGGKQAHEAGELLSEDELADLLRVTVRTLGIWRTDGSGPAFIRAGPRRLLYRRADVAAWLDQRTFRNRAAEIAATKVQHRAA